MESLSCHASLHQLEAVDDFLLVRISDRGRVYARTGHASHFVPGHLHYGGASSQVAMDKRTQFVGSGTGGMYVTPQCSLFVNSTYSTLHWSPVVALLPAGCRSW